MLDIADALIGDVSAFCTAGKVHAGLDESFSLGRHPLSVAEIRSVGLAAHFGRYVSRLNGVANSRGLRLGIWADMIALIPGMIPHLPPGIIAYDWYYYPFGKRPRMEPRNFAEYDLAPALKARGIEYWGCPMNGAFRHEPLPVFGERLANIRDWWRRCRSVEASGFLVTSWEPNRLAIELTTAIDAAAACLWTDPGLDDTPGMLAKGMGRVFGPAGSRELARKALACDQRAFAGISRWEINERWDVCATRSGVARFESERSFFARLARQGAALPAPFRLSIAYRLYLAERDVYVRSAAATILSLRRRMARRGETDSGVASGLGSLLARAVEFGATTQAGLRAARGLWLLTRDRRVAGPNERIANMDLVRLRALKRWIRGCMEAPRRLLTPSPVCGAWQLRFDVVVREPALQRVVVESRGPDGAWHVLHARTLIEFRAEAARPHAALRREMSVPVPGPETPLRIAVRGLGQVGIAQVELTDGFRVRLSRGWKARRPRFIGRRAPKAAFPRPNWERNTAPSASPSPSRRQPEPNRATDEA